MIGEGVAGSVPSDSLSYYNSAQPGRIHHLGLCRCGEGTKNPLAYCQDCGKFIIRPFIS